MDKKTKLWLGVGVVGVGAYLLFKSKKASTPVVAAPAKFVGADSFASVGQNMRPATGMINEVATPRQKYSQDGTFASVGARQVSADGAFASVGQNMRPLSGGMINSLDVKGAKSGSQNQGVFANQPFTGDVANLVGANGDKVFANQTGRFFDPRTARYGQNEGVFAPKKSPMPPIRRTLPVEPNKPMPVTQPAPLNNLVGADGGFFSVHDGFGK